jgi:hypothetical protein
MARWRTRLAGQDICLKLPAFSRARADRRITNHRAVCEGKKSLCADCAGINVVPAQAGTQQGAQPGPRTLDSRLRGNDTPGTLPPGVIVGTAIIERCVPSDGSQAGRLCHLYQWHLSNVKRLPPHKQRKPTRRPQPVWFKPF